MSGMSSFNQSYVRACVGAAAFTIALGSGAANAADLIKASIGVAKILELPTGTSTIIVGNPLVADLTLLKKNTQVIITGKSFGRTNLIALDSSGAPLGESTIVISSEFKGLIVQRGMEQESYECAPRCLPTVNLGDASKFMGETAGTSKLFSTMSGGK